MSWRLLRLLFGLGEELEEYLPSTSKRPSVDADHLSLAQLKISRRIYQSHALVGIVSVVAVLPRFVVLPQQAIHLSLSRIWPLVFLGLSFAMAWQSWPCRRFSPSSVTRCLDLRAMGFTVNPFSTRAYRLAP